jgi:hypothetical protein
MEKTPYQEHVNLNGISKNEESSNVKIKTKTMLMVFFDVRGSIMVKYVRPNHMVNQQFYIQVLTKLQERIKKRDQIWGVMIGFFTKTTHWHKKQF